MAAKSLAGGELYFIGEKDPRTQQDTGFVKVGIVRDKENRNSGDRAKEHQTGNPRLLHVVSAITTPIVERVETTLHGMFATLRLSGEWFFFTPEQQAAAIAAAVQLGNEAKAAEAVLARAEELKKIISDAQVIAATSELTEANATIVALRSQLKAATALQKSIGTCFEAAAARGVDLGRFFTSQEKKATDRFSETDFKAKYPDLWEQYQAMTPSFSGSFLVTDPKATRPDPFVLNPQLAALVAQGEQYIALLNDTDAGAEELHQVYLESLSIAAPIEWQIMVAEDAVKSAIGTASEVDGLFKWNRTMTEKQSLNKDALKAAEPAKFAEFVVQVQSKAAVVVAKDRGFQIPAAPR